MGKFNVKKIKKELKSRKKSKDFQIKKALKSKKLLKIEYSKEDSTLPVNATLLFGAHNGEKIIDLLNGYNTARYVMEYLAKDKNLPKKFRKTIRAIINNQDPFDEKDSGNSLGLNISEIDMDEDLPW